MKINNEKGIALVLSLFTTVMLMSLGTMFVLRTIHESRQAQIERSQAKAVYAAHGGSQAAIRMLDTLINDYLLNTVSNSNPNSLVSFTETSVTNGDGIGWLLTSVRDNNVAVLLQNGNQAEYPITANIGGESYTYNIIITEKTDPVEVSASEIWDFPYNYLVESVTTSDNVTKQVNLNGDFTVRIQKDNFAKYALFTNNQTLPNGTNVWFTGNTDFDGPVHTNGRYNIARNPSGIFDGLVEQQEQTTRYYNNGSNVLLDADFNGTTDVPTFNAGFNRNATAISLSSPVVKQDMMDQASFGATISGNGIYVPNDGSNLTGGIYVDGNATVNLSVDGNGDAVYAVSQSGTTMTLTVDRDAYETHVHDSGSGTTTTYSGLPDGSEGLGTIIYVDGSVTSMSGTVQQNTEITIAATNDFVIGDHVLYENYTAAVGNPGDAGYTPPTADGADNILGIVSWEGDVLIGNSASNDVNVHATVLAQSGILQVDDYNDQGVGPRGTATILGGVISDYYGAFGLFSGSTGNQLSGYGRNFVYDDRMLTGSAPPYYPTLNTFIAFTNDITDKIIWQEGE